MEFNRLVSLVLGFIVLILAFVWISNRFRANNSSTQGNQPTITIAPTEEAKEDARWNPLAFLFDKESPTPTLTSTPSKNIVDNVSITTTPKTQVTIIEGNNTRGSPSTTRYITPQTKKSTSYNQKSVQQIPETGAPTALLPIISLLLAGGFAIKKSS